MTSIKASHYQVPVWNMFWLFTSFVVLGIWPGPYLVSPLFMAPKSDLSVPGSGLFWGLSSIGAVYILLWFIFAVRSKGRHEDLVRKQLLGLVTSFGLVSFSIASFAISALGANNSNPALWWVVGTSIIWLLIVLIQFGGVKGEIFDREYTEK